MQNATQARGEAYTVNSMNHGKKALSSANIWKSPWKRWVLELALNASMASEEEWKRWVTRDIPRGCCNIMGTSRSMFGTQETHWGNLKSHAMTWESLITRGPDPSEWRQVTYMGRSTHQSLRGNVESDREGRCWVSRMVLGPKTAVGD